MFCQKMGKEIRFTERNNCYGTGGSGVFYACVVDRRKKAVCMNKSAEKCMYVEILEASGTKMFDRFTGRK